VGATSKLIVNNTQTLASIASAGNATFTAGTSIVGQGNGTGTGTSTAGFSGGITGTGNLTVNGTANLYVSAITQNQLNIGSSSTVTIADSASPGNTAGTSVLSDLYNSGTLDLKDNASQAMRDVNDRPRQLLVGTECEEGDRVRLSVKDSGVRLEPDSEEKLFQAFYTTKNDGMGIGLSVSRSIIENHRGRIWASANEGPSATFSFSIPHGTNLQSLAAISIIYPRQAFAGQTRVTGIHV
jgi:hypothetical protein